MEQANYWMWMRRKLTEKSNVQAPRTYNDSWEEQAFAEDSAGPLGGCIWPPRSYSCSFCRREFRSAQALGGHMNVHRRDRARLKQSPNPHSETSPLQHQNPSTSLVGVQYPSQVYTSTYTPNPSSNPSASRVLALSALDKCNEKTLMISPSYSATMVQEHRKGSLLSATAAHSDSISIKLTSVSDSKLEEEKKLRTQELGFRVCGDYGRPDSHVSLSLTICRSKRARSGGDEDEVISGKKRKIDATSLPFFVKPNSSLYRHHTQSKLYELHPSSMEEIDLELRLGDRPKVK